MISYVLFRYQDLLMDARDKLLFEPEYAGNVREKIPPKSTLRIPWAWLSGALCLLQEVQVCDVLSNILETVSQFLSEDCLLEEIRLLFCIDFQLANSCTCYCSWFSAVYLPLKNCFTE